MKKGIIVVTDPNVADYVQKQFPDWVVVITNNNTPFQFVPAPYPPTNTQV